MSYTGDKTVRQRLTSQSTDPDYLIDGLKLRSISDRSLGNLFGGKRQRVAIATTLLSDADLYLFDEPSAFLDAKQRSTVSQVIHELIRNTDAPAIVIEHGLAMFDLLTDGMHILYGESDRFGVVSQRLSARVGINQFLDGNLTGENVQIRNDAIKFSSANERVYLTSARFPSIRDCRKDFRDSSCQSILGRLTRVNRLVSSERTPSGRRCSN